MPQSQQRVDAFNKCAQRSKRLVRVTLLATLGVSTLLVVGLVWNDAAAFERSFHERVASFGGVSEASLSAVERQRLQTILRQGAPEARVEAARELARWRDQASVGELVRSMQDGSGVRRPCQIAHALGRIGASEALPALREALDHPDNTDLRACAALAIGEIEDAAALPFLLDRIEREALSSGARASAVFAIWDIADPRALPDLKRIAGHHIDPDTRRLAASAARALACLEAKEPTRALLEELVSDAPWVRSDWVLRQLKRTWAGPSSSPALNAFLRSRPDLNRTEWLWLGALLERHQAWEAETLNTLTEFKKVDPRRLAEVATRPNAARSRAIAENHPKQ